MKHPFLLRPYARTDEEGCLAVWRSASESAHPFLSRADLDDDARLVREIYLPAAQVTVAERDGAAVGFAALYDGMLGGLFVDPKHQGQGIGAALISSLGAIPLTVEVYAANRRARGFYAAKGFAETLCHLADDRGRPYPLIRMERPSHRKAGSLPARRGLCAAA